MRALFRVDASVELGSGHVMRCLTLAQALREAGGEIVFLTREGPGHALPLMRERGFAAAFIASEDVAGVRGALRALGIKAPIDWLVVDHYRLAREWETPMREMVRRIAVIDDLADRAHDCDALLDQNYYADAETRYRELVAPACRTFLGPRFALLRKEFHEAARLPRARDGVVKRILISFGGSDPTNETGKVLSVLRRLKQHAAIDVIIGPSNPIRAQIERECAALPGSHAHVQTSRMAELMLLADLSIGAGGATTWERCLLGVPAITVAVAENQVRTTSDLAAVGATWYLGRASDLTTTDYERAIDEALRSPQRLLALSAAARRIMGEPAPASGYAHPLVRHMLRQAA